MCFSSQWFCGTQYLRSRSYEPEQKSLKPAKNRGFTGCVCEKICIYCAYLSPVRKLERRYTSPLGAPTKAERLASTLARTCIIGCRTRTDKLLKSLRTRRHILLGNLHTHIAVMPRLKTITGHRLTTIREAQNISVTRSVLRQPLTSQRIAITLLQTAE